MLSGVEHENSFITTWPDLGSNALQFISSGEFIILHDMESFSVTK